MRSLFLRIFLWFWLAIAAVVAVLVISSPFLTRSRPRLQHWQARAEQGLLEHSRELADRVGRRGRSALERPGPAHRRHRGLVETYLLDRDGRDPGGAAAARPVRSLARRAAASNDVEVERSGSRYAVARPVTTPDGESSILVLTVRRRPTPMDLVEPEVLVPRLLALLLVAGVLCLWLARYLSAPITALRQATQRLSDGDLTVRLGRAVGSRRDEIGSLGRDFDAMAERLERLLESQQRLLRDVSHELRSPLARLTVALELARRHGGDEATSALDRIERESARLDALIEQLLTLNRLESSHQPAAPEAVELAALVREVVDDAEFEARGLHSTVELVSDGQGTIVGRPSLLRSAIENVIRNALRYTATGTSVEVNVGRDHGEIVVIVRDHGPGVPEEHLDHLFEPFFRVADARERDSGGTGLGLTIAARAARLHGGTATASNHPDGGLVVELRLPVR